MAEIIASTYECLEKIGSGGGGNVYLANHLRLGKKVVLKADKREITTRPELLRREVDVLKDLSYPHIPQVYDFFVENDTVYTVMDYIKGESLDKPLKRGERYPQPQVIKWAKQLLGALCYLHSPTHGTPPRGFVHSDIKPANLMRTPENDICLIDFNIALALGEENVIGCSAGYASPEHYGLDFSSYDGYWTATLRGRTETIGGRRRGNSGQRNMGMRKRGAAGGTDATMLLGETDSGDPDATKTLGRNNAESSNICSGTGTSGTKTIIPDIRSDIYSVGATLYHLLSGRRPARSATEVEPLSETEFSAQIVAIIAKSMQPNPDLRYQTAEEMLYDFSHLYENDVRMRRWKRNRRIGGVLFSGLLLSEIAVSFVGLKRMQALQEGLKLAEYSANALSKGDVTGAVRLALQAIPEKSGLLQPEASPEARMALTDALGVYDLSDGFRVLDSVTLPSAPFDIAISPEGTRFAAVYAYETAIYDTEKQTKIVTLQTLESALSDVLFLDENRIVYAGAEGVTAYDTDSRKVLWTGEVGTKLTLSGDGKRVASVNRSGDYAVIYAAEDGRKIGECSFEGKHLPMAANDIFADPEDCIFALNGDGSLLAVSFADGGLTVFDLIQPEAGMIIYEESDYGHFEGGFCGQYFAYGAGKSGKAVFGLIDTREAVYLGGYDSRENFLVQAGERGIYIANGNLLVSFDPETFAQKELASTGDAEVAAFSVGERYAAVAAQNQEIHFYDSGANLSSVEQFGQRSDFVEMAGSYTLFANRDEPTVRVMELEKRDETQLLAYDARYRHDEARISHDGKRIMLFWYQGFRIYDREGELVAQEELPDADQIYDQQFVRSAPDSWLEVTWYDGTVRRYSAEDGRLLSQEKGERPEKDLYEEFFLDGYRIASPLHGVPEVYNSRNGKLETTLEEDSYLTYVNQAGEYIVTEYIDAQGERYGILLDRKFRKLARLPGLCDLYGDMLVFDYGSGDLRQCPIYSLEELVELGRDYLAGD